MSTFIPFMPFFCFSPFVFRFSDIRRKLKRKLRNPRKATIAAGAPNPKRKRRGR